MAGEALPPGGARTRSLLRSAGVAAIRFLIDNPLVVMRDSGVETGIQATRIAALVW